MPAQVKKPLSRTVSRASVRPMASIPTNRYPAHAPLIEEKHRAPVPLVIKQASQTRQGVPVRAGATATSTHYPLHIPLIQPHHTPTTPLYEKKLSVTPEPETTIAAVPDVSLDAALEIEHSESSSLAEIEPAIERENRMVYQVGTIIAISIVLLSVMFLSVRPFLMNLSSGSPVPSPTPVARPTAVPLPPKSGFSIDIYNGTGVAGRAGTLKTTLMSAGFTVKTVGNAKKRTATTEIHVTSDVPSAYTDELRSLLGAIGTVVFDLKDTGNIQITLGSDSK
jgi:hypothetical protein